MAEAPASTSSENSLSVQWKLSNRRCRKSGCSNIFAGVNLQQLHKLFRTAGDRDAEHQAKLAWRGTDADTEEAEEAKEEEGLVQALVGLRVRVRNKAGIRVEGHRAHKHLKALRYLRTEEPLSSYSVEDVEVNIATEEENQNPFKPSTWRLDVARQECGRHSERYLHRIPR